LEETFKDHLVQLPCNEQRYLPLDQVAQVPVQPDLECLQGWRIHHISGQPVHGQTHYCSLLLLNLVQSPTSFSPKTLFPLREVISIWWLQAPDPYRTPLCQEKKNNSILVVAPAMKPGIYR